jgi:hypothetical protein
MQFFKGDPTEVKMYGIASNLMDLINLSLRTYYNQAYECVSLGEFLYDSKRIPLTNAVKRDIFIGCFKEIIDAWGVCGTFESYLTVFRKIFGEDATIEFVVPAPGRLQVNVESAGTQGYNFIAREIVGGAYIYYDIVDYDGDNVLFENPFGIDNQYELERVLFSLAPNGIFTEVSLTIGA